MSRPWGVGSASGSLTLWIPRWESTLWSWWSKGLVPEFLGGYLPRTQHHPEVHAKFGTARGRSAIQKEMEQLAKELRQKRMTLGYSQADVGFAVGAMFGKVLSQTTICRFKAQQLSLANMWKLRPLLQMWLEEVDEKNLLGICRMEMILQQARKQRRASRERRIGSNLEKLFLQCPEPTPQQINYIAGRLRLQKDLVQVWFSNRSQMGSWPTSDTSQRENVGATGPPFPGPPVCFPWAPGLHFDFPHYGGSCLAPLCSSAPFPVWGALLSARATTLSLPRMSSWGAFPSGGRSENREEGPLLEGGVSL